MSIQFGHTYVPNFSRIFSSNPKLLTRHPYLNYLRQFKQDHPKSGFKRLLQEGSRAWRRLSAREKNSFTQKEVMMRNHAYHKRSTLPSTFRVFPRNRIPMAPRRRYMSASKNIKQSWRAAQHFVPRRKLRKVPQIIQF